MLAERGRETAERVESYLREHVVKKVMALGGDYARHDGHIQNIEGDIISTSRQSLLLGAGPSARFYVMPDVFAVEGAILGEIGALTDGDPVGTHADLTAQLAEHALVRRLVRRRARVRRESDRRIECRERILRPRCDRRLLDEPGAMDRHHARAHHACAGHARR